MYKFKIKDAAIGQYRVQFVYNSEVMVWSENYTTKANAQNCINSIKLNAPFAPIVDTTVGETGYGYRFEIYLDKAGEYRTRFKASNGEIMVWSEGYSVKQNAKNCAVSVRANAPSAPVVDETVSKAA